MHRRALAPLVLVVLLAASVPAVAQDASLGEVSGPHGETLRPLRGENVTLEYRVVNVASSDLLVFPAADPPSGWTVRMDPENATVAPGDSRLFVVALDPGGEARAGTVTSSFTLVDRDRARHQTLEREVDLEPQAPPRILGVIENPLPAPLDGAYGAFLLNLVVWAGAAFLVLGLQEPVIRKLGYTDRTERVMRRLLRGPTVVFILVWGLERNLDILPPFPFVRTVGSILDAVLVIVGLYLAFRIYRTALLYYKQRVAPATGSRFDEVLLPILEKGGAALAIGTGVFLVLQQVGIDVGVLLAAGGFAGIVVGFAAQNTLSNFFSGVNILLDRPFVEGDDLELETGEVVRVETIGLRTTRLYHYRKHEEIVIPNNDLATKRIVNLMHPDRRYRWNVDVGVAYGTDVELVRELLHEATVGHPEVLNDPDFEPIVLFREHGDSALLFTVRFFIADVRDRWRIGGEVRKRVDALLREHGITIPFPQRSLWFEEPLSVNEGEGPDLQARVGDGDPRAPGEPERTGAGSGPGDGDEPSSSGDEDGGDRDG